MRKIILMLMVFSMAISAEEMPKVIFMVCEGELDTTYERKFMEVTSVSGGKESGKVFKRRTKDGGKVEAETKTENLKLSDYLTQGNIMSKKGGKAAGHDYLMGISVCYPITDKDSFAVKIVKDFGNYSEATLTKDGKDAKIYIPSYGVSDATNPPKK